MRITKIIPPVLGLAFVAVFIYFIAIKNNDKNIEPANSPSQNQAEKTTLQTLTNDEGGVTVEVTPINLEPGKPAQFEINFTTHQGDLNFDLLKQAVLTDGKNKQYSPATWDGGNGGHHLTGTLIFSALPAETKNIKLIIKDVYGVPERIFEWSLQ